MPKWSPPCPDRRFTCETQYWQELCRLCEAQNWRCCYCGIRMNPKARTGAMPTKEHVQPRSSNGVDGWFNLAAACKLCNNGRGSMRWDRYLKMVQRMGREAAAAAGRAWFDRIKSERKVA